MQHYATKHPGISPPKEAVKRDALRRKKSNSSPSGGFRQNKFLIISAIVVLVIIVVSVGVYYDSASNKPISQHDSSTTISGIVYGINVGDHAPNITITLVNGTTTALSKFLGHMVLLYFVATWCPGCQQAAQMLNQQYYSELHSKGVIILTIELYNNLNQNGPSIQQFANEYGGGTSEPGWLFGTSTQSATYTYDPGANLEAYYLINPSGVIIMTTGYAGLAGDLPSVVSAA